MSVRPPPLLALQEAEAGYEGLRVLPGTSFALGAGECVALLGRNGMGKTTLLKAAAGWLPLAAGQRLCGGRDATVARARELARAGILLVPEDRGIFGSLSVRENLVLGAQGGSGRGGLPLWDEERVLARLPELASKLANPGDSLSGGERQMLAVARALLAGPSALLLDETAEGLSPRAAERVWALLAELKDEGRALVVVDKDWRSAARLADRVVFLHKGEAAHACTGADLLADPATAERWLGV